VTDLTRGSSKLECKFFGETRQRIEPQTAAILYLTVSKNLYKGIQDADLRQSRTANLPDASQFLYAAKGANSDKLAGIVGQIGEKPQLC